MLYDPGTEDCLQAQKEDGKVSYAFQGEPVTLHNNERGNLTFKENFENSPAFVSFGGDGKMRDARVPEGTEAKYQGNSPDYNSASATLYDQRYGKNSPTPHTPEQTKFVEKFEEALSDQVQKKESKYNQGVKEGVSLSKNEYRAECKAVLTEMFTEMFKQGASGVDEAKKVLRTKDDGQFQDMGIHNCAISSKLETNAPKVGDPEEGGVKLQKSGRRAWGTHFSTQADKDTYHNARAAYFLNRVEDDLKPEAAVPEVFGAEDGLMLQKSGTRAWGASYSTKADKAAYSNAMDSIATAAEHAANEVMGLSRESECSNNTIPHNKYWGYEDNGCTRYASAGDITLKLDPETGTVCFRSPGELEEMNAKAEVNTGEITVELEVAARHAVSGMSSENVSTNVGGGARGVEGVDVSSTYGQGQGGWSR